MDSILTGDFSIKGWDVAHAFANVPLQLHYWDVDFACWCSYKYGCTGAGGLAGLFVHERFKTDKRERMLGWWSHKIATRFNMDNVLDLDDGAAGYRISNPPIHLVVPVMGILEVFKNVSLQDLRSRSCYLTGYLEFLIKHFFAEDSEHRYVVISRDRLSTIRTETSCRGVGSCGCVHTLRCQRQGVTACVCLSTYATVPRYLCRLCTSLVPPS
ncbi:Kynureninase protein, partial [Trichostrongylus colubriformis]